MVITQVSTLQHQLCALPRLSAARFANFYVQYRFFEMALAFGQKSPYLEYI
jgi:hypothetical protein